MDSLLQTDIKFLPGVGPKRGEMLLSELGVSTFEDLLRHYPYKYTDRTKFYSISEIQSEESLIQIKGKVTSMELVGKRPKQRLTARFEDSTGAI